MKTTHFVPERGMTLVELMIAMTIGLLLLAGAASMFMTNKRIYQDIGDLGALQENGRFALELMLNDLRMAGHPGCSDDIGAAENRLNSASGTTDVLNFKFAIEGSESGANWQPSGNSTNIIPTLGGSANGNLVSGTDAITVRYLDPVIVNDTRTVLRANMTTVADNLPISNRTALTTNDLLAVSDCDGADIFQVTAVNDPDTTPNNGNETLSHAVGTAGTPPAAPNNASNNLSRTYSLGAQIARYVVRRYFVGRDTSGSSLYWETPTSVGSPQVLVSGVNNMQILYGKDTDGDGIANSYLTASAVGAAAEWDKIVDIKLALLIATPNQNGSLATDTGTYNLLGTVVGPYNDQRRRRIYTSTIQIRNRIKS